MWQGFNVANGLAAMYPLYVKPEFEDGPYGRAPCHVPTGRPATCHTPTGRPATCHTPTGRPASCHAPTGRPARPLHTVTATVAKGFIFAAWQAAPKAGHRTFKPAPPGLTHG